jgi:hypothetical protein
VSNTPELDKMRAVIESGAAEAVTQFIDWLNGEGYMISRYEAIDGYTNPVLLPSSFLPERLMAQHFGIDLDKIEAERRAILDALRAGQS